jgi:dihydroxyacetone kinase DhaKLM complex PTS-EIIA-like component DhaM
MANLASKYRSKGRGQEAEELGTQVMEASSAVPGEEHADTILSMANLASTYRNQER